MRVVILAGGRGTRLAEETIVKPKPLVEIGGRPVLWHIMHIYGAHGFTDFIVCLGYKGHLIKEYFSHYALHRCDVTFDLARGRTEICDGAIEPWRIACVDTGDDTMTGGRVKRVADVIGGETFMMTYGDGVADVDVSALVAFHRAHGKAATVTAVRPLGRFGALWLDDDMRRVRAFEEKPEGDRAWVNGGFFVLEPAVLDYIEGDETLWERDPLERLARDGQLAAYRHQGFWQPMDTLRDKTLLEDLWNQQRAPWKVWE
jgi:glucose-1-phosphate cytidylyltransferase